MTARTPGSSSLAHEAEPLVTVKEVAALLHVSTETVLTWVRTGRLPTTPPRRHAGDRPPVFGAAACRARWPWGWPRRQSSLTTGGERCHLGPDGA
ncbi:helix-turn-helix domain-containing protein [Halostreptopolyspora alba]